jgi:hypothetical protein
MGIRDWESGIRDEEKGKAVKFSRWLIGAATCLEDEAHEGCFISANIRIINVGNL